jgi:hypothetical protein
MPTKKIVQSPSPSADLATAPSPEPCEMALEIARAEYAAIQGCAVVTAEAVLDSLAGVGSMTAREILVACRVSQARIAALQSLALSAMALE